MQNHKIGQIIPLLRVPPDTIREIRPRRTPLFIRVKKEIYAQKNPVIAGTTTPYPPGTIHPSLIITPHYLFFVRVPAVAISFDPTYQ